MLMTGKPNVATIEHITIIYINKYIRLYYTYNNIIYDINLHVSGLTDPSSGNTRECENVENVEHMFLLTPDTHEYN